MSDKKRSKRRKDDDAEEEAPSKDELSVAKWLKSNVPTKKTKFLSHQVEYFTASKALDALMVSKFAQREKCLFRSRESAIKFLNLMLIHKFFHRAKKVTVSDSELRRGKKTTDKEKVDDDTTAKKRKAKDEKVSADDTEPGSPQSSKSKKGVEKKKRKIRLEMHPDQVFVDGAEAYVWIYDPIPVHYWAFGTLIVIASIAICLFPLWPPMIRMGVYYLSIAAAGFLGFVLGLTILRYIIFTIVWTVSGSKHHLWIFPNLTEDVGFFESFMPIYSYEYHEDDEKSKKKKHKKDKDSDEEDTNVPPLEAETIEFIKENETGSVIPLNVEAVITSNDDAADDDPSELQDENSKNSSETEGDNDSESSHRSIDRDFEMINTDDVDTC